MAFHISDKDGQPRPCKAASPESCPVGGEHFADKEKAQGAADEKLASEYSVTSTLSKKSKSVDFSKRAPLERLEEGRYPIAAGEYYVLNSESMEFEDDDAAEELVDAITNPSNDADVRDMAMIGGTIDGEPVYSSMEHWSGVSNSLVTPKVYKALVGLGMKYDGVTGSKPPVVVFKEATTVGSVGSNGADGDEDSSDYDYGYLEVGDQRVDLFNAENSIMQSERTVIGESSVPTKPAKQIDFSKVEALPAYKAGNRYPEGHQVIPSGLYYAVSSESMETPKTKELEAVQNAILDPSNGSDTASDKVRGGFINGEPVFSAREGKSGVTNSLVTPKVYKALVNKGLIKADKKPKTVEVKYTTTIGAVDDDSSVTNQKLRMSEDGKGKENLFNREKALFLSEITASE